MSQFSFKQFSITQDESAMKVGTDGVLLGAWCRVDASVRRILDIGTGTGVIAIMLAQRAPEAHITGVDIESVDEARRNAAASPWGERLSMVQSPVQEFGAGEEFDLIVSNPPYFLDSLKCPQKERTTARHTDSLSFGELCEAVARLLSPEGRFAVVLPVNEGRKFVKTALSFLNPVRCTEVKTTPRRGAKRVLMEFARLDASSPSADFVRDELVIGTGEHECYTEGYKALTRDFYLKFD